MRSSGQAARPGQEFLAGRLFLAPVKGAGVGGSDHNVLWIGCRASRSFLKDAGRHRCWASMISCSASLRLGLTFGEQFASITLMHRDGTNTMYEIPVGLLTRGAPDKLSDRIVGFRTIRYPAGYFLLSGRIAGY